MNFLGNNDIESKAGYYTFIIYSLNREKSDDP